MSCPWGAITSRKSTGWGLAGKQFLKKDLGILVDIKSLRQKKDNITGCAAECCQQIKGEDPSQLLIIDEAHVECWV